MIRKNLPKYDKGGFLVGHYYKAKNGKQYRYIGEAKDGKGLFTENGNYVNLDYSEFDDLPKKTGLFGWFKEGGLVGALGEAEENLKKNGIVLTDKDKEYTVIAYNTGNQERSPALYNKLIIYNAIMPVRQASEIIEQFDAGEYEHFDESKIDEYKKGNLFIVNQNEVMYENAKKYEHGGKVTFDDKVKAVTKSLKGKKVKPKYKKKYGNTYDAKEAKEAAQNIVGAMKKKYKKM
jgi:hypothetical protein